MLKYKCLVLDHDDTVVMSEETVHYPCFCAFLRQYRPGVAYSFSEYLQDCNSMPFVQMCRERFSMSEEEMHQEYLFWKQYIRTHIPQPFAGMDAFLHRYRECGGTICVVSMSEQDHILRDYRLHFQMEPDAVFGYELPADKRKPSTYALEQIQERFGFSAKEMLVVDDMRLACEMAQSFGSPIAFAGWGRQGFDNICNQMRSLCDFSFLSLEDFSNFIFSEV